jgi:hypothetical protein
VRTTEISFRSSGLFLAAWRTNTGLPFSGDWGWGQSFLLQGIRTRVGLTQRVTPHPSTKKGVMQESDSRPPAVQRAFF